MSRTYSTATHGTGEALGVIRVHDRAGGARHARRRAGPANAAALAPFRRLPEGERDNSREEGEGRRELHLVRVWLRDRVRVSRRVSPNCCRLSDAKRLGTPALYTPCGRPAAAHSARGGTSSMKRTVHASASDSGQKHAPPIRSPEWRLLSSPRLTPGVRSVWGWGWWSCKSFAPVIVCSSGQRVRGTTAGDGHMSGTADWLHGSALRDQAALGGMCRWQSATADDMMRFVPKIPARRKTHQRLRVTTTFSVCFHAQNRSAAG